MGDPRTRQPKRRRLSRLQLMEVARKQAESSLLATRTRFEATFDQAAVGIAHVNTVGEFMRVNRRP